MLRAKDPYEQAGDALYAVSSLAMWCAIWFHLQAWSRKRQAERESDAILAEALSH